MITEATLGILAGTLTTISFFPQVLKVYRSKSANDLSWGMLSTFATGVGCWFLYGAAKHDLILILANGTTLSLTLTIVLLKHRYRHPRKTSPS